METADAIYYSKEHTWVKIEKNIGTIGITSFAQKELGEIVYVDLPEIGDVFEQDEVFGSVEALKTVSDLFIPLSGEITETNEKLLENPARVNEKPLNEGWMIKIEIKDLNELKKLLSPLDYDKIINE